MARAGLLPELSAQTYSSFYRALREVVLNAIDAGASRIDIDFSHVESDNELVITDNGRGMTIDEFSKNFMSVGGSPKFGDADTFGRIGIGSLALLHYGEAATVETKTKESATATVARISHPWEMDGDARRVALNELAAGWANTVAYSGSEDEHFTILRLERLDDDVRVIAEDPGAFYDLIDALRRVLPLPWGNARLVGALSEIDAEGLKRLANHVEKWSIDVFVHAPWERNICLTRRFYGDGAENEQWGGVPRFLNKRIRVQDATESREVVVLGFLLQQMKADPSWSGLTARVQNVAVEEACFFDVTADAGFRKYITGEIYMFGDLDQDRLINIDRSSFNRECLDYVAVQRYMAREIHDFKSQSVQASQRRKVAIRRILARRARSADAIQRVASVAESETSWTALPSSGNGRIRGSAEPCLKEQLQDLGASLEVLPSTKRSERFSLSLRENRNEIVAAVPDNLQRPHLLFRGREYALKFNAGSGRGAAVVIKNRPREIVFDTNHPAHQDHGGEPKYHVSLALEVAHLMSVERDEPLYECMLGFVAGL